MKARSRRTALLGEVVAAAFGGTARYSADPARCRDWPRRPWRTSCTMREGRVAFAWHRSTAVPEPQRPFYPASARSLDAPSWATPCRFAHAEGRARNCSRI